MFKSIKFQTFRKVARKSQVARGSVVAGIFFWTAYELRKTDRALIEYYDNLSPEEQEKVYNACAEQRLGRPTDVFGAIVANTYQHNQSELQKIPLIKPYKHRL